MRPAKLDVAVQEDFQQNHLEPRLTEASHSRSNKTILVG
jgi:hypothetical protein